MIFRLKSSRRLLLALYAAFVCGFIWTLYAVNWTLNTEPIAAAEAKNPTPSILCFIPANPTNLAASRAVKETWGSRCDALLFFRFVVVFN